MLLKKEKKLYIPITREHDKIDFCFVFVVVVVEEGEETVHSNKQKDDKIDFCFVFVVVIVEEGEETVHSNNSRR